LRRSVRSAAVVDDQERVIAIDIGGLDRSGVIGIGNPVTSFEPALRRALLARSR
jgi:hypothetical protein